MRILPLLRFLVGAELAVCAVLFGLRLNATLPATPAVADYTDAMTGAEILAVPDRFLFDSAVKWRTLGRTYMQTKFFAKAEACLRACRERAATRILRTTRLFTRLLPRATGKNSKKHERCTCTRHGPEAGELRNWRGIASVESTCSSNSRPKPWAHSKRRATIIFPASISEPNCSFAGIPPSVAELLLERLAEDHPRDIRVLLLKARWAEVLGRTPEASVARDTVLRSMVTLELDEPRKSMIPQGEPFGMFSRIARIMQERQSHDASFVAEQLLPFVSDETIWQNKVPLLLEDVAEVQLEARNFASARDLLEKQIEKRGPKTNKAWELLAQVELAENHLPQAWRCWNHAERLRPNGVDHEKMAQLAQRMGDSAAARRHRGLAAQCAGISCLVNEWI